jgi:hypothetical protein
MVQVKGFPRSLYPPDAAQHGKQPSMDGADVEAYKRTVSRAGRWPWGTFNRRFTNDFAHGQGGNVKDTGVAGVQRQSKLDDTGWIGMTTFNLLRSILVPEGLPHAGEHAMDAPAITLVNQAWEQFKGHEPEPLSHSVRQAALEKGITQVGTTETPPGSNLNPYGAWYGMDGAPWCAMFVSWCFEQGAADLGKDSPSFARGSYYSYVPYILGDAQSGSRGLHTTIDPIPGDLVCYDWNWDGIYDHVGIFSHWDQASSTTFHTVEGNTSAADYSNGGMVLQCARYMGSQGTVFVRVDEPS